MDTEELKKIKELKEQADNLGYWLYKKPKAKTSWQDICCVLAEKYQLDTTEIRDVLQALYDKHTSHREAAKECGVSAGTFYSKMCSLGIKRRNTGGAQHVGVSLQPKLFGFLDEKTMIHVWRKKLTVKQIQKLLRACDVKISLDALQKRVQKLQKEEQK
uniref:Uncharacterized protein n=1 Tax=viral metagenome TaxID=1070528 RepID=A0A6M3JI03_9ZZZZ